MTQTETPLPDLTITARSLWSPTFGDSVTFYFDGFLVGNGDEAVVRLTKWWRMTPEVANAVVTDLWNEVTAEDGWDFAEITLSENPS